MELHRYLGILRRRLVYVLLAVFACATAAWLATPKQAQYSAESVIYVGARQYTVTPGAQYSIDVQRRDTGAWIGPCIDVNSVNRALAWSYTGRCTSPGIDVATRERVTAALLSVHEAPAMATTLDELLLARFVRVAPEVFEIFLERERAAETAGYAKLG